MNPTDDPAYALRVARIEDEHREMRADIRGLTKAVSDLATTVAVLAESVRNLTVNGSPVRAAASVPAGAAGATVFTLGGAALGAAVARFFGLP